MSTTKVAVIVLNYQGEHVLTRCLTSLEATIQEGDTILVVDNGNETVLMDEIATRFPSVDIVVAPDNRGFAAGMNLGIRHLLKNGGADAFWLFNNDAVVLPETLGYMKEAVQSHGVQALYSPIIYPGPGTSPWFAGGTLNFLRMRTEHWHSAKSESDPYPTDFLTGCALFIPREALDLLGLLDTRYFLYYEDAEYSLRAKRHGLKRWVVPAAKVYHSEASQGNSSKVYWLVRSGAEFFLRESHGRRYCWVRVYFFFRKLKNWVETRYAPRPLAREVERAYTDVSL